MIRRRGHRGGDGEFEAQPEASIDAGEHLVVMGTFRGRSKAGHQMQARYAHVWRMRDGKAVSFQVSLAAPVLESPNRPTDASAGLMFFRSPT